MSSMYLKSTYYKDSQMRHEYLYDDGDDVYLRKITTRVSQNLILHKYADQPNA
jgi:hypothetical protein